MGDELINDLTNRPELQLLLAQFAMDNASIEIYWLGSDARIYYANNHACITLGYTKEELLELTLPDLDPNYPVALWGEHWEQLKQDKTQTFETVHKRKNGQLFPVEVVANYVSFNGHEYNVGFAKDITERKQAEQALQIESNKNLVFLRNASDGIHILDTAGVVIEASDSFCSMLGYPRDEIIGMHVTQWDAKLTDAECSQKIGQQFLNKSRTQFETLHRRKDGSIFNVEISGFPFELNGKPVLFNSSRDITERIHTEQENRIAATAFETNEGIMITDAKANILRVNHSFQTITGFSSAEVLGKNPRILQSGRHGEDFYAGMWQQLLADGVWKGEIWDRRKSGEIYPKQMTITAVKDKAGEITEYVAIFNDITERKASEDEVHSLAFYDTLTRLPNRRLLLDRFRQALSVSARSFHYGALLFLDMDRFKTINDTLGHDHGDLLLIEVAKRINSCVREVDTVARLGGDEFVILLEEINANAEDASQRVAGIAEKIRAALAEPYWLNSHEYHSSPSIGVCLYRGNDESVDSLLKHADMAMYQAKYSGRNAIKFFDPSMQQAVESHAALEADFRHAVPDKQLRLHYQIQMDNDHRPFGAEALVRWVHPLRGMVSPAQFIPIAEESSLILDAGNWVLQSACQQLALWSRHAQTCHLELAINVSAQQFRKRDFVEDVTLAVRLHQINPQLLKLELTEGVVLADVADVVTKMYALKALGVKLSLDDFGTGYSSLSYLKQLPLDQLKIDQSFVRDITTDLNDAVMVQTIIGLAKNFRLNVIAEGVETDAQLTFLKQNGCMAYQGYLFSKPVPIDEFELLLRKYLATMLY